MTRLSRHGYISTCKANLFSYVQQAMEPAFFVDVFLASVKGSKFHRAWGSYSSNLIAHRTSPKNVHCTLFIEDITQPITNGTSQVLTEQRFGSPRCATRGMQFIE